MSLLKRWLPVVAWSAVILATSNDWFSASHTQSWLNVPESVNVTLRKLAHLTGYGILGALAWRAARIDLRRALPVAYAVVIIVASIDEWHQSTVPSRGGSPWDVLLDVAGATVAIALMHMKQWRSR